MFFEKGIGAFFKLFLTFLGLGVAMLFLVGGWSITLGEWSRNQGLVDQAAAVLIFGCAVCIGVMALMAAVWCFCAAVVDVIDFGREIARAIADARRTPPAPEPRGKRYPMY